MTPEGKVKARVKSILTSLGAWYAMPLGTAFGKRGVPDFLVCHRGKFFSIETKAGKGKTTALQEYVMARIREAGGVTLIINEHNVESLPEYMEEVV